MQPRVRFLMIGGFLGAGKTTAIARLAHTLIADGAKVGLVTNDQAYGLVDTHSLRAQGFMVGEVTGACFCCKFDDLVSTATGLAEDARPDVIIAEPVGSCTDLVATVIEPLRVIYGDQYEIGPFAVLLKPEHGQKILRNDNTVGFSPKASYIFLKQLEEADVIVLNKIDKLSGAEREELLGLIGQRFPDKEVLTTSAKTGEGFESLIEVMSRPEPNRTSTPEIDYDIYAAGEAELGWLNCTVRLGPRDDDEAPTPFSLDERLLELVGRLRDALARQQAEPAHLKVFAESHGEMAVANLVGSEADVELSRASGINTTSAQIIVNARVAIDPERLTELVETEIAHLAAAHSLVHRIEHMQCFRPGRPVPTHRMPLGQ